MHCSNAENYKSCGFLQKLLMVSVTPLDKGYSKKVSLGILRSVNAARGNVTCWIYSNKNVSGLV